MKKILLLFVVLFSISLNSFTQIDTTKYYLSFEYRYIHNDKHITTVMPYVINNTGISILDNKYKYTVVPWNNIKSICYIGKNKIIKKRLKLYAGNKYHISKKKRLKYNYLFINIETRDFVVGNHFLLITTFKPVITTTTKGFLFELMDITK